MKTTTRIRAVWAALTAEPCISVRALARRLGLRYSTAAGYVRRLRAAGYIEQHGTARRVVVGLWETKQ